MTTTMSNPAAEAKQTRSRMIFISTLFGFAFAISFVARYLDQVPPEPNYSGYYNGAWVNKKGELVSESGAVLRRVYSERGTPNIQFNP